MKITGLQNKISHFFRHKSLPYLRENAKIIGEFVLTLFFIALAIWFIKHEKAELHDVKELLVGSSWKIIAAGTGLSFVLILFQGLMYKMALSAMECRVPLWMTIVLFLKRNVISIFLPAGGVSSLAFFTEDIEKKGISKTQVHLASSVYAFTGILTVVMVAIPSFIYAAIRSSVSSGEIWAVLAMLILIVLIYLAFRSIKNDGVVHRWLVKKFPVTEVFLADMRSRKIEAKYFALCVLSSIGVEFTGIAILYLAMIAMHLHPTIYMAIVGYITSVVFLAASPFLRGLGAVEVSMTFIFIKFGLSHVEAISVTLMYRIFEFWLVLFIGAFSFLLKINKLLMRVIPALLLLTLGIINIVSVLTPAVASRLERIQDFIPIEGIAASNFFVLISGLFLLITAAFMLKGLRSTWWIALLLSAVSFIGHLVKAIDYEEAAVAGLVILVLIRTHKEYYIKTHPKLSSVGLPTALLTMLAVIVYGTIGFYYLDKKHFNIDFNTLASIRCTLQNYFLIGSADLVPNDAFARNFLLSIKISGFFSIVFIVYVLVRPYVARKSTTNEEYRRADELVRQHGNSGLDYFKLYEDKSIFALHHVDAFVSFRVAGNFAVALENPVAENQDLMKECIVAFDRFCYDSGMKSIYFRVPEESLPVYNSLGKKSLFLGQEGIIDLETFTLEGRDRKTLRHAINQVSEKGYTTTVHTAPVKDGTLQKLKSVSDEWLRETGREELVFSQGMFKWEELKQQTILTAESPEEKIVAFMNIIPDYAYGEGTYDLLRRTSDAPHNVTEFLLIRLCEYLKSQGFRYVNLGFAPMSGIDDPQTFPEKSMHFAYEKIKSFSHFKGQREFKERFFPQWSNRYLIYDHDYDLLQVPRALSRVIKP
jgi:phosphatidylglycerol lysyltransferase